ncbi:putative repeat protein (TIGR01451 family)/gliding motility-associated-like protein [Chitinophaga dinghuensis]|uniref:Putative repeat protein (TIGR01451 family)/gliding motility-associated-like protein n=1 Tax=Chitinophaga dinghuensis TaxID=1539050 RepID=A0A327VWG2_9BACT|nr:gliding motility-associated C-terminal domain-containing protein [Chitinophaga dinghuensis]RAJ80341.1 putative repeat protein (TIGR01451 family)/gliding motility-associated-like protein [Chitinophaga dinghuensis]
MTKKTFLAIKYWLTAVLMLCCFAGTQAQTGTFKNTAGASGNAAASAGATPVSDITYTTFQFPSIGLAIAAAQPVIQNDGSYNIAYTYTIQNLGGLPLTGVQVVSDLGSTFGLPMSYTIVSRTFNGIAGNSGFTGSGNTNLLGSNATLAAGSTVTAVIVINLKNAGQYGTFNTQGQASGTAGTSVVTDLSVNGTVPDANGNGSAFDDQSPTPVTIQRPDIAIQKTVDQSSPYVGNNITFTITATNVGSGDAAGVNVEDPILTGFKFLSATPAVGTYNSTTGTWAIGILKAGESKTLTVTVQVNPAGVYDNTASCDHPEDIVTSNNSKKVTVTPIPSADVRITKIADKMTPDVLDVVTFTLTASNAGLSDATGVVVTDKLPAGLEPVSPYPAGLVYDPALRQFTWTIGNMAANTQQSQTIATTVSADIDRSNFTNTATIKANEHDPQPGNNTANVTIVPKEIVDLAITKTVTTIGNPIYPDAQATFTITVKNNGPNNCYDANVSDVLPSGFYGWTATPGKGSMNLTTGLWTIGALLKDEVVTLVLTAQIKPSGNYANTATIVTTDRDTDPSNNTASTPAIPVTPRTDLSIDIQGNSTADVGDPYTFDIIVKNAGPSVATGVKVDLLNIANGYTLQPSSDPGFNAGANVWTIGSLPAGSTVKLTLTGIVKPNADYNFNAHVSGNEDEITLANNDDNAVITVAQVADISVVKTVNNPNPEVGSTVQFNIVVTNNGPSTAHNVKVNETINTGGYTYSPTNVMLSIGTYNGNVWSVGTLPSGQSESMTITAVVVKPNGNYLNSVNAYADEKDKVPANNTSSVNPVPVQLADVGVSKSMDNMTPDAGTVVKFTIVATNYGPSTANNVEVNDLLNSGYTFQAASPTSGIYSGVTGKWNITKLLAGQSETLTITAMVNGDASSYDNTATIKANEKDKNPSNDSYTVKPTVRQTTDLQVKKVADKSTVDINGNVTFTITVTNNGASKASGVTLTDVLPAGLTFVSASPATYISGAGTWDAGTMNANTSKVLTIVTKATTVGTVTNTASVSGNEYDPIPGNNSNQAIVTIIPITDLAVNKTVDNSTPDVGTNVTFTITATNNGPSDATGVKVIDALPAGYTFVNAAPLMGTYAGNTWTIGSLLSGQSTSMTVTATVKASGPYANTATISGNETDRTTTNNSKTVTPVPVPVADLAVIKTVDNSNPDAGSIVKFTITATNNGPSTAANAVVTDLLGAGYTFQSYTATKGTYVDTNGKWTIGSMNNGKTETLTITAKVKGSGPYINTATITSTEKDKVPGNNSSNITPNVRPVTDLSITKTADKSTADINSYVTFTLTATNNGPSDANGVTVTDVLPQGLTFVSASSPAFNAGIWNIDNMGANTTQQLTIVAQATKVGSVTNVANISGTEYDPTPGNNSGQAIVNIIPITDLQITKTVDHTTPDVGSTVTFTITATNAGPSDATGVTVNDVLPAGYTLVANPDYNGTAWNIGTLTAGQSKQLTVQAVVKATGPYANTATITGNETDRNLTNNTDKATPVPVPVANIAVNKTADNMAPDAGTIITFTITATNAGPSPATSVIVSDLLNDGYTLQTSTPSVGTYNSGTGIWNIGTLNNGASATLTMVAKVKISGNYSNTATIQATEKDPDPTNNSKTITPAVRQVTDLAITKTVNNPTADAGSDVVFTLTATNKGVSDATGVVVNDLLPTGFTFVSANPQADYDDKTGVWTIGDMSPNATTTLTITATVNPTGVYANIANISGNEYDPVTTNNSDKATVNRIAVTDLEVQKVVDNNTPDVGTIVTFTITATNHGPSTATGVVVADVLPLGYAMQTNTPDAGAYDGTSWNIGSLNAGQSVKLIVTALVKATGPYRNTATISGTEVDRNPGNNSDEANPVPVPVADLAVIKSISNAAPDAGSTVTFTITATNNGPSTATTVTVTDQLLSGYKYLSQTASLGSYDETTGIWTIGNMTNGQTATLTIDAQVLPTGVYDNTAVISSPVKDKNTNNNTSAIATPQVRPVTDLAITKVVDKTTADVSSTVVFTLQATNNGPSTATNVSVQDLLPTGFTFVTVTGNGYDHTTGTWNIGTMNSGSSETLVITATVNPSGNYTNTATISGTEYDPNTSNNQQSATVTAIPVTDLEVIKTVDNNTPDVGSTVTFVVKATNHGPSPATNVAVTDAMPSGYQVTNSVVSAGALTGSTWNIGTLQDGETATLTITATVLATGNYSNTATVTGTEKDPDLTNNSRTVTPVPVPVTKLRISKTISNQTPDVSSQVTFTITATNDGPSDATSVTVKDILQSGYQFKQATATVGSYSQTTGIWNIGNLANGQTVTLQIVATVLPAGDYNNSATIDGNEKDTDPTNNTDAITPPVPVPVADISINKTISQQVPGTGDVVTFTIVVKNNGASNATNVVANDKLQSGFTFQQATADKGTYDNTTGIWNIGAMNANESATLTITVKVNTTGIYSNTATVTATEKDPVTTNNTSNVTIVPDPITDLYVTKAISNMAPPHTSDVTFTIVAGNNGPSDATGVTVTDILPSGYTLKSATPKVGTYNSTTGIWTIGQLANGASVQMTVVATVNKTGNYTNTATISGNETDRVIGNNSDQKTPVPVPLRTNDDHASTEEPDPVVIDVLKNDIYGNTGHDVHIQDKPQHGTVTVNADGTVTYTPVPGFGGTDTFTYYIQDQSGFASNVSTVTVDVTKRLVDLAIKKVIVTPPAEIAVGKNVIFELTVTNNSSKGASRVVVTDILANNVGDMEIKTSYDMGQESYDPATKTMRWNLDTLAPGQTVRMLITAKVTSGGNIQNTATVTGDNSDPDLSNNSATASTSPKGADVFIPTAFTPNGDGINDKFVILGIDKYPGSTLVVFNRWGNVVYRSNDYRNEWDGAQLNAGTYYYELVCPGNNGKISMKGWVQLVR